MATLVRDKKNSRRDRRQSIHPERRSTYFGPMNDSDEDEFHITMPFKWNEDRPQDIMASLKFEPDEEYALGEEAKDKQLSAGLRKQN